MNLETYHSNKIEKKKKTTITWRLNNTLLKTNRLMKKSKKKLREKNEKNENGNNIQNLLRQSKIS